MSLVVCFLTKQSSAECLQLLLNKPILVHDSDRPPFLVFCPETLSITLHFLTRSSVKKCTEAPSEVKDCYCGVQINFNGMTPLGTNLNQKIIQPFLMGGINNRNLQKPILVIIITDGEPTGEPQSTVAQVIKNAKNMSMNSPYGPGAIAFEFAQVGKDQAAQAFLGQLDRDPGAVSYFGASLPALIAVLAVYRPCFMRIPTQELSAKACQQTFFSGLSHLVASILPMLALDSCFGRSHLLDSALKGAAATAVICVMLYVFGLGLSV